MRGVSAIALRTIYFASIALATCKMTSGQPAPSTNSSYTSARIACAAGAREAYHFPTPATARSSVAVVGLSLFRTFALQAGWLVEVPAQALAPPASGGVLSG